MNTTKHIAIALVVTAFALPAFAAGRDHRGGPQHNGRGNDRVVVVHQRDMSSAEAAINRGLRSGDLTQREAQQLRAQLNNLRRQHTVAARDGRIDRREAERLARAQDRFERELYQQLNDRERARYTRTRVTYVGPSYGPPIIVQPRNAVSASVVVAARGPGC